METPKELPYGKSNPFIFFSAGQSLNDKDRDLNSDLREIQNFFKPIDNLFGDYEILKKFDLQEILFRKAYSINRQVGIISSRDEFKMDAKTTIDLCKSDNTLLIFFLIYDFQHKDIFVDVEFVHKDYFKNRLKNQEVFKEVTSKFCNANGTITKENWKEYRAFIGSRNRISKSIEKNNTDDLNEFSTFDKISLKTLKTEVFNAKISQIFVVDPEKLIHAYNLSDSRYKANLHILVNAFKTYKGEFNIEKYKNEPSFQKVNTQEEAELMAVEFEINEIKNILKSKQISINDTNIYDLFSVESIDRHNKLPLNYFIAENFIKRKYKLKNYETMESIKARIGYEDNHYVLFLHPYDSESNGPVRFPPQQ